METKNCLFFESLAPRGELSQQFVADNTRETTPRTAKKKRIQKQTYNANPGVRKARIRSWIRTISAPTFYIRFFFCWWSDKSSIYSFGGRL